MWTLFALFLFKVVSAVTPCDTGAVCTDERVLSLETSDCQKYHMFSARGSDSIRPGAQGEMMRLICESLDDCGFENIDYPANSSYAGKTKWCESAAIGASGGQAQLADYATRCPDSKLIIIGYSQGGSVSLDMLGGGGGSVFECVQASNPPLDRSRAPGSNIVAAITFGAVVRTANQPWSVEGGGEKFNGTSPRSEEHLAGLRQYTDILREYCNFGDPVCAQGSEPVDVAKHLNYFKLFNKEAAEWVINTAQGKKTNTTSSATTSSTKTGATKAGATEAGATETGGTEAQGGQEIGGNEKKTTTSAGAIITAAEELSILWVVAIGALLITI